eukprot:363490-Chlamydomonas_euryale.AAC.10
MSNFVTLVPRPARNIPKHRRRIPITGLRTAHWAVSLPATHSCELNFCSNALSRRPSAPPLAQLRPHLFFDRSASTSSHLRM